MAAWIERRIETSGRYLIGIDCNFAYSQEIGQAQFGPHYTYIDLWRAVDETSRDLPNFFAEGFWCHKIYGRHFWLAGPKPPSFKEHRQRITEKVCRDQGYGLPESPFKLIGPKQVGKGGLAGMRMLCALKKKFGDIICVWPFETHIDTAKIVITEIYPRLFIKAAGFGQKKIRNGGQLNQALSFFKSGSIRTKLILNDHMTDAIVSSAGLRHLAGSGPSVPDLVVKPEQMTDMIALREGWIWGVNALGPKTQTF